MTRARLLSLLEPQAKRQLALIGSLVIATALCEAASVTAIYPFLLVAMNPDSLPTGGLIGLAFDVSGAAGPREFLLLLGTVILGLVILSNALGAFTAWRQQRFVRDFEQSLSVRMLRHFLYQPYPFFLRHNTSEIQRRLLKEPRDISDGALDPALDILQRGVATLAVFAVLLAVEPRVAVAAALTFGALYVGLYRFAGKRLQASGERVHRASQVAAKASAEALNSIKLLKVTRREEYFVASFVETNGVVEKHRARHAMFSKMPRYVIEGATFALTMVAFLVVLAAGRDFTSILPLLGMFAFAGFRLMPAVHGIVNAAGRMRFGTSVLEAVVEELSAPPPPRSSTRPLNLPFHQELRLDNVRFAYADNGRIALDGVSFRVPRGTSLGIVGRTGSGKTTVLDILLGILEPTQGQVLVDGSPLDAATLPRWQQVVSYVPQQVVLLDDTIARNIAFGVPDDAIDMARVRAAARSANIQDYIETDLPDGYATTVGERGVRLSGGQRQRIGIARALYENREVIVFDEATSEVDSVTERAINEAIAAMAHKKTIIVVAHRLTAIRECDQVLVLEDGRVAARGNYDELLQSASSFQSLAQR